MFAFFSQRGTEILPIAKTQLPRSIDTQQSPFDNQRPGLPMVLMLAFYFPPENAIGAARPGRFAKYLSRLGYPVSVISQWIDGLATSAAIRVPAPDQTNRLMTCASTVVRWFARAVMPYDDRLPWVPHAFRAASAMLARNPDYVIVSSHPPLATHIVALALKWRHSGRWVADFRDPLIGGHPARSGKRAALFDTFIERLIFKHADIVIANTDAVRQMWLRRYPQWKHKIHLIWNGFDREDAITPKPMSKRIRRRIAHLGTIYGGRTPEPLIASLDRLVTAGRIAADSIQLRLIGPIHNRSLDHVSEACRRLLELDCLHIDDHLVPQAAAREETLDADYLVLLDIVDNDAPGIQLPAKIFDYIRACRPILAFTPANSVISRVLDSAEIPNTCVQLTASAPEIDRAVQEFLDRPRTEIYPGDAFWRDFDSASQTYVLANLISGLSARPGREAERAR